MVNNKSSKLTLTVFYPLQKAFGKRFFFNTNTGKIWYLQKKTNTLLLIPHIAE